MLWNKIFLLTGLLLVALLQTPALAQTLPNPADSPGSLSLSEAMALAYRNNPRLWHIRREYAQAEAHILQAGLLPNPELALVSEDFAGSAAFTSDRFTQFTLQLSQNLPLSNRIQRHVRLAQLKQQLLLSNYQVAQLQVAKEVFLSYGQLAYLTLSLSQTRDMLTSARATQFLIEQQVNAGKQPLVAALQAHQKTQNLLADEAGLESQYQGVLVQLATLWGGNTLRTVILQKTQIDLIALADFGTYQKCLIHHPRFTRWTLEGEYRQQVLLAAQTQSTPDLNVSSGLRYHPPLDWGLVISLGVPLPVSDHNQAAILEAKLNQESLNREREQELRELSAELQSIYVQYQGAYRQWLIYREQLKSAQKAFEIAQAVFAAGKTGYLEVLQSQESLFQAQKNLIQTQWNTQQSMVGLRVLTQDLDTLQEVPITEH